MQQHTFEESRHPWQESFENVSICMPFRCPRCGDHTRFRSLSSLRAHLEYNHRYEERSLLTKCNLFSSLKDTDVLSSSETMTQGKLGNTSNAIKQKPSYINFCDTSHENPKNRKSLEMEAERPVSFVANYGSADFTDEQISKPRVPITDSKASFEAHVREKFNRMVDAVDKTIEKRIDKLTKELAQKTAELLEVRAAFAQLSQKKQEVQRRERDLNRQVDVAVEMIALLKQRLTESEEELHRKEESRGNQHGSYNIPDAKPHSLQKDRMFLKKNKDDKNSIQPVTFFYEPVDCSRELWRPQKRGEPVSAARKVNSKSKQGKKGK
ncbi:protein ZNF365 isoform X2 [Natator depressus]|uniref:protein ZNF365 isoform X2 n=1 Tax=Natator depressus TaxID=27790 RepID=UPI003EBE7BA5